MCMETTFMCVVGFMFWKFSFFFSRTSTKHYEIRKKSEKHPKYRGHSQTLFFVSDLQKFPYILHCNFVNCGKFALSL